MHKKILRDLLLRTRIKQALEALHDASVLQTAALVQSLECVLSQCTAYAGLSQIQVATRLIIQLAPREHICEKQLATRLEHAMNSRLIYT